MVELRVAEIDGEEEVIILDGQKDEI